jgi:hypothetical protein
MSPLTVTQILVALFTALQTWAAPLHGKVSIARDPFNVLEILSANPAGYRLVVHWAGDDNISDIDQLPLVEHTLEIVLSYNLGLTRTPDQGLVASSTSRPPLYDVLDSLRSFVLAVQYPTEQTGSYAVYAGAKPFITPDGIPLAAYVLTFKLKAAVNVDPIPLNLS